MDADYLIVGLGNPGPKYQSTRHNLGFMIVTAFAEKQGWTFKRGWRLAGKVASGDFDGQKVHLLMPGTYMNLSGTAVRKAMHYYKIPLEHLLIVVDEVYLPLGTMRLRGQGSPGGHNGLKHIEACLGTQHYPRLRVGVGPEKKVSDKGFSQPLEEYVLANFNLNEQQQLPKVIENGVSVAEAWLKLGLDAASHLAGSKSTEV